MRLIGWRLYFLCLTSLCGRLDGQTGEEILALSLEELLSIKIRSATQHDEKLSDIPATVYVYTSEDISRAGYHDLMQLLAHVPGVEYAYPHSWLQGGQRGFAGNWSKTKLLIDGMDANLLFTGEAFIGNQFMLDNAERVEIIMGPGSVVYGADAFSGVINIVTKKPSAGKSSSFANTRAGFGQDERRYFHGSAGGSAATNKAALAISGGITRIHDANLTEFVKTPDFSQRYMEIRRTLLDSVAYPYRDENLAANVQGYAKFQLTRADELTLQYHLLYDVDGGGIEAPEIAFTDFKTTRTQHIVSLGHLHSWIGTPLSLQSRIQYRYDTELNDYNPRDTIPGGAIPVYNWDIKGSEQWLAESYLRFDLQRWKNFSIGGVGYYQRLLSTVENNQESYANLKGYLNPHNPYLFVQSQQKLYSKLYLTAGLRKDFNSLYPAPLSLRGALQYNIAKMVMLRYIFSNAFRAPTLFDLQLNSTLLPEQNYSHELCLIIKPNKTLYLQSALFYTLATDIISTIIDPSSPADEDIYISANNDALSVYGLEQYMRFGTTRFVGAAWFTLITTDKSTDNIAPLKAGLELGVRVRKHHFLIRDKYISPVRSHYLDSTDIIRAQTIPFYHSVDLRWLWQSAVSVGFVKADVGLTLENLLNRRNYYPNMRGYDPGRYIGQQRSLNLELRVRF